MNCKQLTIHNNELIIKRGFFVGFSWGFYFSVALNLGQNARNCRYEVFTYTAGHLRLFFEFCTCLWG